MKANKIFFTILVSIISIYGCEKNDSIIDNVRFDLEATEHKTGDTIRAYFINENDHDIYRYRPSPAYTWLEKFKDENWESVIWDYNTIQVEQYDIIKSGESVLINYPYNIFEQMIVDSIEGTYRLTITISITPDHKSDHKIIVSQEFTIK